MKKKNGFLLVGVLFAFLFLLIIVPVMVKWAQNDTKLAVKDQKSSIAFSLAEAAVDRGFWKVKGSTATFASVMNGNTMSGYNFDTTYTDISGGTYRIRVSSGPGTDQVTVTGEGRDSMSNETRSVTAVYLNSSIAGPILTSGHITLTSGGVVHWGPIMAAGDVTVPSGFVHYPRKLSRQTVKPLDPTGDTNPPNTDNKEWWSNYNVPDLPVFDFNAMRSSAAATGTLNCQDVSQTSTTYSSANTCVGCGCYDIGSNCSCSGSGATRTCTGSGCAGCTCSGSGSGRTCSGPGGCNDCGSNCNCSGSGATRTCTGSGCNGCTCGTVITTTTATTYLGIKCCHYNASSTTIVCDYGDGVTPCTDCKICDFPGEQGGVNSTALEYKDFTWYWDNNFSVSTNTASTSNNQISVRGTIVVRGNMSTTGSDNYPTSSGAPWLDVPPGAHDEYKYFDTSTTNQYPGDLGLSSSTINYRLGSCGSTCEGGATGSDLGIYGFTYVGGDLTLAGDCDVYGALWVEGNVYGFNNANIFYNARLKVPTLNVVLGQQSWTESKPSPIVWP